MNEQDFNLLYEGQWLHLRIVAYPNSDEKYEYIHQASGNGAVALLVYRGDKETPILGSFEVIPCHFDEQQLCAITGLSERDEESKIPIDVAIKELREETGFEANEDEFIHLGTVNESKHSDTITHLFAIDVTNKERKEKTGDGTVGEELNYCDWVSMSDVLLCKDSLFAVLIARMNMVLETRRIKEDASNTDTKEKEES